MASAYTMTQEQVLKVLDDAIARKKAIADGESAVPFTTAENMLIYNCVYNLINKRKNCCKEQIYEKYTSILEERIMEKAIPRLLGKHGASLLTEVTKSWSDFKAFADSIFKFFLPLDRVPIREVALVDTPRHYFCKLVCERLYGKIQEAVMNLVIKDREGKEIDRNLLKSVFQYFLDLGEKGTTNYYAKFEQVLLAETSAYYSELSMEWWFWRDSYANYLRKVDLCLVQEEARAEIYQSESTKEKILTVMKYVLLERNAKRWTQKLKTDGVRAEDEELVRKYSSLSYEAPTLSGGRRVGVGHGSTRLDTPPTRKKTSPTRLPLFQ